SVDSQSTVDSQPDPSDRTATLPDRSVSRYRSQPEDACRSTTGAALALPGSVHLTSKARIVAAVSAVWACAVIVVWAASTVGGALPGPMPLFPPDNWWNADITNAPIDGGSPGYVSFINNGSIRRVHPDFGGDAGGVQIYGFPY